VPVAHAEAPVENLVESWPEALGKIAKRLGPATTGLLTGSNLKSITGDTLTIEFPPTGKTQKQMCESNGRGDQIAEALGEYLGRAVRVKFMVAPSPVSDEEPERKPIAERQRQILSDPGVKTVLMELGATVTGIEEE